MRRTRVIVSAMLAGSMLTAGGVAAGVGVAVSKPGTQANPIKAKNQLRGGFLPARVTVKNTRAGVTIHFRSTDSLPHNATPVRRIAGAVTRTSSSRFTLKLPRTYRGTFTYFCTVHPTSMGRGMITVTG